MCFGRCKKLYIVLAATLLLIAVFINLRKPLLNRIWDEDVSVLAAVSLSGDSFELNNIRNWQYAPGVVVSRPYIETMILMTWRAFASTCNHWMKLG